MPVSAENGGTHSFPHVISPAQSGNIETEVLDVLLFTPIVLMHHVEEYCITEPQISTFSLSLYIFYIFSFSSILIFFVQMCFFSWLKLGGIQMKKVQSCRPVFADDQPAPISGKQAINN